MLYCLSYHLSYINFVPPKKRIDFLYKKLGKYAILIKLYFVFKANKS